MIDNSKEYIICSAIHYDNYIHYPNMDGYGINSGFVIGGYRHHNIISVLPTNIFCKGVNEKVKQLNVSWSDNTPEKGYYCIDIAKLILWQTYHKYDLLLNKKQVNILLYIAYGIYAALRNKQLTNDKPLLGIIGPIFKPVIEYNWVNDNPYEYMTDEYETNIVLKYIIDFIIDSYSSTSTYELYKWAHDENGPWYNTMKNEGEKAQYIKWNDIAIDFDIIKKYFTANFIDDTENNRIMPITIQGFITSNGRFVNRKEAAVIAYNSGQIQKPINKLFSEDLY